MEDSKPWYLSRTIWASIIAVLGALAGMAGVTVGTLDQQAMTEAILQAVTAGAAIVAIIGRLAASTRIR